MVDTRVCDINHLLWAFNIFSSDLDSVLSVDNWEKNASKSLEDIARSIVLSKVATNGKLGSSLATRAAGAIDCMGEPESLFSSEPEEVSCCAPRREALSDLGEKDKLTLMSVWSTVMMIQNKLYTKMTSYKSLTGNRRFRLSSSSSSLGRCWRVLAFHYVRAACRVITNWRGWTRYVVL